MEFVVFRFNMKTKAQGLSLNTIIIAALVLIVLVVLIVIFSGKIGDFGKGSESCPGKCASSMTACENNIGYKLDSCSSNGGFCCPSGLKGDS
jgi:hypothetical protein